MLSRFTALATVCALAVLPLSGVDPVTPAHAETAPAPGAPAPGSTPGTNPGDPSTGSPAPAAGVPDEAAPPSRHKRVIENVHTDAVSAYLDNGTLVLQSKADIDMNGDGVPDLGSRLVTQETLFHVSDAAKTTVPNDPNYAFLGAKDSVIYLAPQTQNHEVIWPGFSTEDPNLANRVQGKLSVRLVNATGPGAVELFLYDTNGVQRVFSSTTPGLQPWAMSVPQHSHMNWAFSKPGTYQLTFEMSGTVDGRPQTASNTYTFVVGDLAAHTRTVPLSLTAQPEKIEAGKPVRLTATTAADAVGNVQFRNTANGQVLGYAAVENGTAALDVSGLPAGTASVVAEFVPTWAEDFAPVTSAPVTITVTGDTDVKPETDDTAPVADDALEAVTPGTAVKIHPRDKTVAPGARLRATLDGKEFAGKWVSAWLHGEQPQWLGWVRADLKGRVSVTVPDTTAAADYRLVVKSRDGKLIGWDRFDVAGNAKPAPPKPAPPKPAPPKPTPRPTAPKQACSPGVVLDHGHIDMFYVSVANDRAVLQLMEDVTGHHVIREAETVLLRVKESAYRGSIPSGHPGAPSGYVLPLTQDPALIWPGWDTNRVNNSDYKDVSIHITNVAGPGRVWLSTQGAFGTPKPILEGGSTTLPGVIRERTPSHTHAQWVFQKKGIYKLTAYATARNNANGATIRSAAHTWVFQVGNVPLGNAFCGLRTVDTALAAQVNAAVNKATAEKVEKDRKAAKAKQAKKVTAVSKRVRGDSGGKLESLAHRLGDAGDSPWLLGGVIGGGALMLAGIIGATVWALRRLRASEEA